MCIGSLPIKPLLVSVHNFRNGAKMTVKLEIFHWPYLNRFKTYLANFAYLKVFHGIFYAMWFKFKNSKKRFLVTSHFRSLWPFLLGYDSIRDSYLLFCCEEYYFYMLTALGISF